MATFETEEKTNNLGFLYGRERYWIIKKYVLLWIITGRPLWLLILTDHTTFIMTTS